MKDVEKRCQLVFITNTRNDSDLPLYKKHPLYGKDFIKPDIYNWKSFSYISSNGDVIYGTIILIGSNAEEITKGGRQKAVEQTWQAINYAKDVLGVSVIGFGINTKTLIKPQELPKDVIFTHGDSLTVGASLQQLKNAVDKCEINLNLKETNILILGAYGMIGEAITKNLAKSNCSLSLVGRNLEKLNILNKEIGDKGKIYSDLNEVKTKIDVVITATNHPGALLKEDDAERIGPNLLIFDPAQPPNVSYEVCKKFKGQLIRIDGAIMNHPNMRYDDGESGAIGFDPKEFPACLGETMVIATAFFDSEERIKIEKNNFMGEVSEKNVLILSNLAKKYGFEISPFTCYKKSIIDEDFEIFKQNKTKNRTY